MPPPAAFGLVVLFYVQLAAPARAAMLGHAARALAPGGRLVLVAHDRTNLTEGIGGPQDATVLPTPELVVADLAASGVADLAGRPRRAHHAFGRHRRRTPRRDRLPRRREPLTGTGTQKSRKIVDSARRFAGSGYFGGIRMPPSTRTTSPFMYGLVIRSVTMNASSSAEPSRFGNSTDWPRWDLNASDASPSP